MNGSVLCCVRCKWEALLQKILELMLKPHMIRKCFPRSLCDNANVLECPFGPTRHGAWGPILLRSSEVQLGLLFMIWHVLVIFPQAYNYHLVRFKLMRSFYFCFQACFSSFKLRCCSMKINQYMQMSTTVLRCLRKVAPFHVVIFMLLHEGLV